MFEIDIFYVIYVILYIFSGSILTAVIAFAWINRKLLKPKLSLLVLIAGWIWFTAQLFEFIIPDFQIKLIFNYIQYIGICLLPAAWMGFSYQYYKDPVEIKPISYLIIFISPVLISTIAFTNSLHHFFWENAFLDKNGIYIEKDFQIGFYLFIAFLFVNITISIIFFILAFFKRKHFQKKQTILILVFVIIFIFAAFLGFQVQNVLPHLDLGPIIFSSASLIMIYFFRLRYYRTIPLAQHLVVESMQDIVMILNTDNQIVYLNPKAYQLFPPDYPNVIGNLLSSVSKEIYSFVDKLKINELSNKNKEVTISNCTYDIRISPIFSWRKKLIGRIVVLRDISRLKETEKGLKQMKDNLELLVQERTKEVYSTNEALRIEVATRKKAEEYLSNLLEEKTKLVEEKNVLLSEIHHRVKNNLQIITSLLKLQKKNFDNTKLLDSFETAISRIHSIAIIHERLYKTGDFTNTNIADYIRQLAHYLLGSFATESDTISLELEVENISFDLDKCILYGLIINELIVNSIKHAFVGYMGNKKIITIRFFKRDDELILIVKDNGVGINKDVDISKPVTLGLKVINTLVEQLKGRFSLQGNDGTEARIIFKL